MQIDDALSFHGANVWDSVCTILMSTLVAEIQL